MTDDNFISKSQKKRDATASQALGIKLTDLSAEQIEKLPLSETLRQAICDYK